MKCKIKWWTRNRTTINKICEKFGFEYHPTINGHSDVEIAEKDRELFLKTSNYGYFSICTE